MNIIKGVTPMPFKTLNQLPKFTILIILSLSVYADKNSETFFDSIAVEGFKLGMPLAQARQILKCATPKYTKGLEGFMHSLSCNENDKFIILFFGIDEKLYSLNSNEKTDKKPDWKIILDKVYNNYGQPKSEGYSTIDTHQIYHKCWGKSCMTENNGKIKYNGIGKTLLFSYSSGEIKATPCQKLYSMGYQMWDFDLENSNREKYEAFKKRSVKEAKLNPSN